MIKRKLTLIVWLFLAAVVFIGIEAFLYSAYNRNPIEINNKKFFTDKFTVAQALNEFGYQPRNGNLLSLDGRIIIEGKGKSPQIFVNGSRARESSLISRGARITMIPGGNLKQSIIERKAAIPHRTIIIGTGSFLSIAKQGEDGIRLEYYAEGEDKVIKSKIIKQPRPTILKRAGVNTEKMVALTFDDGPNPPFTSQIADILEKHNAPATFFVVGLQVQKFPQTVNDLKSRGFAVENHSFSHRRLDRKDQATIDFELDHTHNLIRDSVGTPPSWFRPPFGTLDSALGESITRRGYRVALWSVDPNDWQAPNPETILQTIAAQVGPGGVILLHDGGGDRNVTISALPRIIEYLRNNGYSIVTLDQLYGSK